MSGTRSRPERADWPRLPGLLFDIADRFGLDVALAFAARHGGGYLYVPARASAEHPIAREFGEELLAFLIDHCGGWQKIVVPKGPSDGAAARAAAVRELTAKGWDATRIARRLGVHVRTVHADRAAARAEAESRQGELFGGRRA